MVYLLHFTQPYKHARHYVGYAEYSIEQRVEHHRKGQGANLTAYASRERSDFIIARTWEGGRNEERQVKRSRHHSRLCPICNPLALHRLKDVGTQHNGQAPD